VYNWAIFASIVHIQVIHIMAMRCKGFRSEAPHNKFLHLKGCERVFMLKWIILTQFLLVCNSWVYILCSYIHMSWIWRRVY